jgi:hypothetical protein
LFYYELFYSESIAYEPAFTSELSEKHDDSFYYELTELRDDPCSDISDLDEEGYQSFMRDWE